MKKQIGAWELLGFSVTALVGTLLHFLYEWSGESLWIAPFSGVNESTWEHMKLFFWPSFIYAYFESIILKERADFWCIKLRGIILGLLLIPIIFYTYNGAVGASPDWINISIFFISAAISHIYEYKKFKKQAILCKHPRFACTLLWEIAVLFVIFTFCTPRINLFKDPLSGSYGI